MKLFFVRRVVALMGMYPLHFFFTFVFQHFNFMISRLYIAISLNRLIRKETILSCFFALTVRCLGLWCFFWPWGAWSSMTSSLFRPMRRYCLNFEFPGRYLCIQHGYAKHPNLFPESPPSVTCLWRHGLNVPPNVRVPRNQIWISRQHLNRPIRTLYFQPSKGAWSILHHY